VVGGYRRLYSDDPLLDLDRLNARDLVPGVLMRKYSARNITTTLRGDYVWWRASATPYDATAARPSFNLTATLRFPLTRVSYIPDVAEVLKNAWIQYLAMLVLVAFLVDRLLSFVCYHQVRQTRNDSSKSHHTIKCIRHMIVCLGRSSAAVLPYVKTLNARC
jgi:hypothetical protein